MFTASGAKATGCAVPSKIGAAAPSTPLANPRGGNHEQDEHSDGHAAIVGMWHLNYTAESTSGAPIFPSTPFPFLESFKVWHGDGTEFENAFLPPTGGNICFGVWKDAGDNSVKLHHIGLMFDSEGKISNIFTVDEIDTVARDGETYTGTFTFKLWPPTFASVGVGTPVAEVKGKTAGTRINVD
jgi:hypothetical protein